MRVLLDTNIIIHREASKISNQNIGILFSWLDRLHYSKCIHPLTIVELKRYADIDVVQTMQIKLDNYQILQTPAPLNEEVKNVSKKLDTKPNDFDDTKLLNEVYSDRVDLLISEDKKIHTKSSLLGISDRVFRIDKFLEKVTAENPDFVNYSILSVKREYFGNINLNDEFFDGFRADYDGFNKWYNGKAGNNEKAYVCYEADVLKAFLFLKIEGENENHSEITPVFNPKKRLKIGTFKVVSNGLRIGERFLKIVFDNARLYKVDEIYVTIFDSRPELLNLISLLEKFGFYEYGTKSTSSGIEKVYVRDFSKKASVEKPALTYPWLSKEATVYTVPIRPEYHTELFPDSKLIGEAAEDFTDNKPHRNSISKSYISHSFNRNLNSGDILVFYRSGYKSGNAIHKGVVTTIGIIEDIETGLSSLEQLIEICRKRTVLTNEDLKEFWNRYENNRPFVIHFLYAFSFKKRITLRQLLNENILPRMDHVKTINKIEWDAFIKLIKLAGI